MLIHTMTLPSLFFGIMEQGYRYGRKDFDFDNVC